MPQRTQALKADPAKYPGLAKNPALERALRIQQALDAGKPRDEAVALAEQAMGKRAPKMAMRRSGPAARPPRKSAPKRAESKAKARAKR